MTGLPSTNGKASDEPVAGARPPALTVVPSDDLDARARHLAARYADFLELSPRLAAAWRAFRTASPATRAEAEYELRCLEEEAGGMALTTLREAAEREACRSYLRRFRRPPAA
jgi:hypothetical protein